MMTLHRNKKNNGNNNKDGKYRAVKDSSDLALQESVAIINTSPDHLKADNLQNLIG